MKDHQLFYLTRKICNNNTKYSASLPDEFKITQLAPGKLYLFEFIVHKNIDPIKETHPC